MSSQAQHDLREFQQFLKHKVDNGLTSLSPEEVVDEWRALHPAPNALEEEAAAIQEALTDLENGDAGVPFDQFDRDFRSRHNLPPQA